MTKIIGALNGESVASLYSKNETKCNNFTNDFCNELASSYGGIVEIFGPSGSGKSTLALQIMAQRLNADETFKGLYISTDNTFSATRLRQIFAEKSNELFLSFADRILVQHLGDLESQDHFIQYFLENLVQVESIAMIVIDSISANFRVCSRAKESTQSLYRSAFILRNLATRYGCKIICINQITASMTEMSTRPSSRTPYFRPALGLSWTNCVSTRILIEKDHLASPESRVVDIIFTPTRKSELFYCTLSEFGFSNFRCPTRDGINKLEDDLSI